MAVALDATSLSAAFTTVTPLTLTHTPVGVPRGVCVVVYYTTNLDLIGSGEVKYGTKNLIPYLVDSAIDAAGEPITTIMWFLGTDVPSGVQTVSISHTGNSLYTKYATCATFTSSNKDIQVVASGKLQADVAASIAVDSGVRSALRVAAINSGSNFGYTDFVPAAGITVQRGVNIGSRCLLFATQDTPSTGSFTMSFTQTLTDDLAMIAAALSEIDPVGGGRIISQSVRGDAKARQALSIRSIGNEIRARRR